MSARLAVIMDWPTEPPDTVTNGDGVAGLWMVIVVVIMIVVVAFLLNGKGGGGGWGE